MTKAFCTGCGAQLESDTRFCRACGKPVSQAEGAHAQAPASAPAPAATPTAAPVSTTVQSSPASATQTVTRTASTVMRGATVAGAVMGAPWQTLVAGDADGLGDYARRWAPSLVATLPRPNLRIPARALLFTVALEIVVALLSGQPPAFNALGWRALLGFGTAFWGLVAGRKKGFAQKMTVGMSAVTSVVQVISLVRSVAGIVAGGVAVLPMLLSVVVQIASLVATVKSFILGRRK